MKTVTLLRAALLGLFVLGTVGVGLELLLIEHFESTWQLVPLILMGTSLLAVLYLLIFRNSTALRVFQTVMGLFVMSGLVGLWLHYQGNAEFEVEMYPSLTGLELFWEAIRGATPVLGPGTMVELGLLGLAYTYRHPIAVGTRTHASTEE